MTNYQKGRSREYRIMNNLEKEGFLVFRTAGSHGIVDLIAIDPKNSKILFLQVKPKKFSKKAIKRLKSKYSWLNDEFICSFNVISFSKEIFHEYKSLNKSDELKEGCKEV